MDNIPKRSGFGNSYPKQQQQVIARKTRNGSKFGSNNLGIMTIGTGVDEMHTQSMMVRNTTVHNNHTTRLVGKSPHIKKIDIQNMRSSMLKKQLEGKYFRNQPQKFSMGPAKSRNVPFKTTKTTKQGHIFLSTLDR